MFKPNTNYLKLPGSYLFSTIAKKVSVYSDVHSFYSFINKTCH